MNINSFFGFLLFFLFLVFLLFGRLLILNFLLEFFQPIHGHLGSGCDAGAEFEGSSCKGYFTSFTFPDSTSYSLDTGLWMTIKYTFPHGGQRYLACCWSSNFLTIFLIAEPYRVPYFPVTPTFLVLLAIGLKFNNYLSFIN